MRIQPIGEIQMDKVLQGLLETSVLNDETKAALSEAWQAKMDEVRNETEQKLQEEFAARFSADKEELVEAIENNLKDALEGHTKDVLNHKARLKKTIAKTKAHKVKLEKQLEDEVSKMNEATDEKLSMVEKFIIEKLTEELKEFEADKKELENAKKELENEKKRLNEEAEQKFATLETFIKNKLTEELTELHIDKKNLVEARVRLARDSKKKMEETRRTFVEHAAKLVEESVETQLKTELTQLKEDINEAKENRFGRTLFETFRTEFMSSKFSDKTVTNKLSAKIDELSKSLEEAKQTIDTQSTLVEGLSGKLKKTEDQLLRESAFNRLLSPLNKDQREVMKDLLNTTKTEKLEESFKKYLPVVLNKTATGSENQGRRGLTETQQSTNRVAKTGNRNNKLAESAPADVVQEIPSEIIELRRLAGIDK